MPDTPVRRFVNYASYFQYDGTNSSQIMALHSPTVLNDLTPPVTVAATIVSESGGTLVIEWDGRPIGDRLIRYEVHEGDWIANSSWPSEYLAPVRAADFASSRANGLLEVTDLVAEQAE